MSANNWRECPRCVAAAEEKKRKAIDEVAKSYGKVSEDEYHALRAAASLKVEVEETLREDYYIGINDIGEFVASYTGQCTAGGCGYSHSFKHKEKTKV